MKIIRADVMGLCFGVRDALAVAESIENPRQVTIHGELAHNGLLLQQLQTRGFAMQSETDRGEIPATPQVMITAHGISGRERHRLESAGKQLIDTTCPLVRRVHDAALRLQRDGYHVLVLGKPGHVEVQGIIGDLQRYDVIPSQREVRRFDADKLGIICQTTMPECEITAIRRSVEEQNPHAEIHFIDTVCQPTKDRQAALRSMVEQVEAAVVVGGANSNNTRRLADYCRERGLPTYHVGGPDDLQDRWFAGVNCLGLTAGTSTLPETIDAVHARLMEIGAASERELRVPACRQQSPPCPSSSTPWTSAQWYEYFERNSRNLLPIPWGHPGRLSDPERRCIRRSIQEFQLGETGTGRHFLRRAADYARREGDDQYVAALEMFIREEHRHARTLGRFMTSEGIPLTKENTTDGIFRRLRHAAGLDLIISVLVTAEILAKVYYRALRDATSSVVLNALCTQILRDEVAHVRFQVERLALLRRGWNKWRFHGARLLHYVFFAGTMLVVWFNHRPVLQAGGFSIRRYWRTSWREFRLAMRIMNKCRRDLEAEETANPGYGRPCEQRQEFTVS